jgi:hypothetical protein
MYKRQKKDFLFHGLSVKCAKRTRRTENGDKENKNFKLEIKNYYQSSWKVEKNMETKSTSRDNIILQHLVASRRSG